MSASCVKLGESAETAAGLCCVRNLEYLKLQHDELGSNRTGKKRERRRTLAC
jgi:hypothetical protein